MCDFDVTGSCDVISPDHFVRGFYYSSFRRCGLNFLVLQKDNKILVHNLSIHEKLEQSTHWNILKNGAKILLLVAVALYAFQHVCTCLRACARVCVCVCEREREEREREREREHSRLRVVHACVRPYSCFWPLGMYACASACVSANRQHGCEHPGMSLYEFLFSRHLQETKLEFFSVWLVCLVFSDS